MTSHETRTQNTRTKSSEQNDLKKLKSKYSAKLPTLKVLFSDWSDDDLLFVLEEANGDLDLTIDRISEGHANQWGEVKTKKSKKEAQKAKVATTAVSSHQQQSTTTTYAPFRESTKITPQRSYNERVTRPGKAAATTTAPSNRRAQKSSGENKDSAGSWASIASSKQEELNNEESWTTVNESSPNDDWSSPAPTHNTPNDESNDDQPKTWASLLKSKPKPESEPVTTNTSENTISENTTSTPTTTSEWDAPNTASNDWSSPPTLDAWSAPTSESVPVPAAAAAAPTTTDVVQDEWRTEDGVSAESEIQVIEKEEIVQVNRLVNQEEPVVLPTTTTTTAISSLDVKFGTLNVDEEPAVEETVKETTVAAAVEPVTQAAEGSPTPSPAVATPVAVAATVAPVTASPPVAAPTTTTATPIAAAVVAATTTVAPSTPATAPVTESFQSSAYLKQEPAYAQAQPQHQQAQPQHQQQQHIPHQQQSIPQQQQQQQFGMDHLTSAYSSYLPNQPPTGVSGFGMNPMGNLPDYGIYGSEAQRAAAMGYYDPTAFSHSPSVTSASAYQSRDKYSQEAAHGQSAGGVPQQQQMYPTNLPYYQYYYMPNQFNAYQQSAYGQPFMNKSMYPTMYQQQQQQQQQPGKPGAVSGAGSSGAAGGAGASPYASASPYGQQSQLYNHQSGYDDLNQLGMGLNDYQKSMYGGATAVSSAGQGGFLGLSQGNGQPAQGQAQKSEIRANTSSAPATQAQPQQQQQPQVQQQQVQQQQYAQGNYFGQPQMFSYGQYPQQQQQQQQHHQQQFQQQMPPHGTPSRQQQYWNQ